MENTWIHLLNFYPTFFFLSSGWSFVVVIVLVGCVVVFVWLEICSCPYLAGIPWATLSVLGDAVFFVVVIDMLLVSTECYSVCVRP